MEGVGVLEVLDYMDFDWFLLGEFYIVYFG